VKFPTFFAGRFVVASRSRRSEIIEELIHGLAQIFTPVFLQAAEGAIDTVVDSDLAVVFVDMNIPTTMIRSRELQDVAADLPAHINYSNALPAR
jgi:hypothetical protein